MSSDRKRSALVVYACDIGSTRTSRRPGAESRFGWFRNNAGEDCEGTNIDDLIAALAADLTAGQSIALGFECPLFIPIPHASEHLSVGRDGEKGRSFAAPAGLAVAMLGLHQLSFILRALRSFADRVRFTADLTGCWDSGTQTLYCWEAFVSGKAHSTSHVDDARTAVRGFVAATKAGATSGARSAVTANPRGVPAAESDTLSLLGVAAFWSGWTSDPTALRAACFVVKPDTVL